jgi:hypothetical protein
MSRSAATPQPLRPTGGLTPQRPTAGEGALMEPRSPHFQVVHVIRIAVGEPVHRPSWVRPLPLPPRSRTWGPADGRRSRRAAPTPSGWRAGDQVPRAGMETGRTPCHVGEGRTAIPGGTP